MIQRIRPNEYLKRLDNMTAVEKDEYLKRVGEWCQKQAPLIARRMNDDTAVFQDAIQSSASWNDAECQAWMDGVRLLTALTGKAETWLPDMLYTKAAKRTIRNMISCFKDQVSSSRDGIAGQQEKQVAKEESAGKAQKETQTVATFQGTGHGDSNNGNQDGKANLKETGNLKPEVVRPKHIDQYIHLLPQKTQEKAAQYAPLKREIEAARENMRLLMNDPNCSDQDREKWAKLATRNDEKIAKINAELDAEWAKLAATGRVVVDDLGMAHLLPDGEPTVVSGSKAAKPQVPEASPVSGSEVQEPGSEVQEPGAEVQKPGAEVQEPEVKRKLGRPAMTEEEKKAAAQKRAEEKDAEKEAKKKADDAKRLEYLKKWLRDTRAAANDERHIQWWKNCIELISLGGEITDSIRKAGKKYGVDVEKVTGDR